MKYSKQLEDPRWESKRVKILKRDGYKCVYCKWEDNLQVHHLYYVSGSKAWQYPHNALITLCGRCHSNWHKEHDIEIREIDWSKNKKYKPPLKKKSGEKKVKIKITKRVKKVILPSTKKERQKIKAVTNLQTLNKEKVELIKSANISEETKSKLLVKSSGMSVGQIKQYLKTKQ